MKPLLFKKIITLPILFIFLLLTSNTVFPQNDAITKKESNLRFEQLIMSLRETVEEGMMRLDKIDEKYLTKLSGLVDYDRAYLSKTNEKQFFSKEKGNKK